MLYLSKNSYLRIFVNPGPDLAPETDFDVNGQTTG